MERSSSWIVAMPLMLSLAACGGPEAGCSLDGDCSAGSYRGVMAACVSDCASHVPRHAIVDEMALTQPIPTTSTCASHV